MFLKGKAIPGGVSGSRTLDSRLPSLHWNKGWIKAKPHPSHTWRSAHLKHQGSNHCAATVRTWSWRPPFLFLICVSALPMSFILLCFHDGGYSPFASRCRTLLSIYCRVSLVVINSISFCLSRKDFISPLFLKDICAGYSILDWLTEDQLISQRNGSLTMNTSAVNWQIPGRNVFQWGDFPGFQNTSGCPCPLHRRAVPSVQVSIIT